MNEDFEELRRFRAHLGNKRLLGKTLPFSVNKDTVMHKPQLYTYLVCPVMSLSLYERVLVRFGGPPAKFHILVAWAGRDCMR
jgi:hypothetical protein